MERKISDKRAGLTDGNFSAIWMSTLTHIREVTSADIIQRDDELIIKAESEEAIDKASRILDELMSAIDAGEVLDKQKVQYIISAQRRGDFLQGEQGKQGCYLLYAQRETSETENTRAEELCKQHKKQRHRVWCGARGDRQDLYCGCNGNKRI